MSLILLRGRIPHPPSGRRAGKGTFPFLKFTYGLKFMIMTVIKMTNADRGQVKMLERLPSFS